MAVHLGQDRRRLLRRETRRLPPSHEGRLRVALVYPNVYSVGMANLGYHAVLELLLRQPGVFVDRVFWPAQTSAQSSSHGLAKKSFGSARPLTSPVVGIETGLPLREFDVVLCSLSFEPDFVNLALLLELGGVDLCAAQREGPLVAVGGIAVTLNPEPIAELCDVIGIGEAETLLPPFLDCLLQGGSRQDVLDGVRQLAGWYVPMDGPQPVARQCPQTLRSPIHPVVISPDSAFSRHVDLEISRGCRWRCRFCASGYVVTPYREVDPKTLQEPLGWALAQRQRVGLVGTDVSDHSQLRAIAERIWDQGGEIALPSLRVESVARRSGAAASLIRQRPLATLTLAVEASCESLRHALGKRLSDAKVLRAAQLAAQAGVQRLRVYALVGIPGETEQEVRGLIVLAKELLRVGPKGPLTLSVNGLVPKPGTPLQWHAPPERRYLRWVRKLLRKGLPGGRVDLQLESPDWTRWQALLSLAGREATPFVLQAARDGWRRALAQAEREVPLLAGQGRDPSQTLPWAHISHGVERSTLREDLCRFERREYVPPR